jgi:hypothetical protein
MVLQEAFAERKYVGEIRAQKPQNSVGVEQGTQAVLTATRIRVAIEEERVYAGDE